MKQFTILDGKCLAVELPERVVGQLELKYGSPTMDRSGPVYLVEKIGSGRTYLTKVGKQSDNWQILDRLSELTEEKAAGLVELPQYGHYFNYAYENPAHKWLRTARESLESAIRSQGYYLDENPIPHPDDISIQPASMNWYFEQEVKHKEAQSRLLSRDRLLVLRRVEA